MHTLYDSRELTAFAREHGLEPEHIRRVRNAFLKRHFSRDELLQLLSPTAAADFRNRFRLHPLHLHKRLDSRVDGATKLMLQADDGARIETVLLRQDSGRTTVCLSCQVGCAGGCAFCATGQSGLRRNLTPVEILDQLAWSAAILRNEERRVRNVVFMGMGEPFHNEPALSTALDTMLDTAGLDLSPARLMVSTVGIPDAMVRFADRYPRVPLAVSLHTARPAVRERLMPVARRHPLPVLRGAIDRVAEIQDREVMVEVLLLADVTDTDADLDRLRAYLTGLRVWVNLISYNAVPTIPELRGSSDRRRELFEQALRSDGLLVMTRESLGGDIAAACGQLAAATPSGPTEQRRV